MKNALQLIKKIFIGLSLLFALFTLGRILFNFKLFDFNIYYLAGRDLLVGRELYKNPQIDNNYPPSALLFTLPFSQMPQQAAEKIWTISSLFFLISSIIIVLKSVNKYSVTNVLLVFSIAIWTFPVKFSFGLGQINFLILFFYSLSIYFSIRKKDSLAGMFLGLAAAIKLTPLLLVLFLWRKRRFTSVLTAFFTFLCLQLIGLLAFSSTNTFNYVFQVLPNIPTVGNAAYYNQAITGLLARAGLSNQISWFINYLGLGFLVILLLKLVKSEKVAPLRELMEYGGFIILSLLGAGLAWQHHFIWLLIPIIGLWFSSKNKNLILFVLILIGSNLKNPELIPNWAKIGLSHVGIGTGIVLFLLFKKLKSFSKID